MLLGLRRRRIDRIDLRHQRRSAPPGHARPCCSRWPSRSGITPQLLPAVVSTSLAAGSRQMSRRKVLVKRLVCIEDLGDVDTLFTDKTGTLTLGPDRLHACGPRRWPVVRRRAALGPAGYGEHDERRAVPSAETRSIKRCGILQRQSPNGLRSAGRVPDCGVLPFDHERRMVSVLVCVAQPEELTHGHQGRSRGGPAALP